MSQLESDHEEPLPPCSVPPTCEISLRGLGNDAEWNGRFQEALREIVVVCGRFMDLSMLDGVTVGFDYDDALASVDLGYESQIAKQYTNTGGLLGVGKTLRVKRKGQLRAHVVINANCLVALADHEHEMFWPSANIVAHELAHVAVIGWFEAHSPGLMLSKHQGDWATATLRDAAHAIWEEYAACRLSACVSKGDAVTDAYVQGLEMSVDGAMSSARDSIKAYRTHAALDRLLVETSGSVANPMKIAAYLMGHMDGLGHDFDLAKLCPTVNESEFGPLLPKLLGALRDAWDTRLTWNGLEGADGIVQVVAKALATAGAIVTLNETGQGSWLDVPFTAETMPNGEADMAIIRARKLLGL